TSSGTERIVVGDNSVGLCDSPTLTHFCHKMEVQQMQMAPSFGSLNELTHDKIRRDVKQRRLRLHEFFKTFDMHRTKKITRSCFRRALDTA
ncbi:unnamed protein product, partial [Chrysoparadoxa australica]